MVTGSTGFVGQALCAFLAAGGYRVFPTVRGDPTPPGCVAVGDIGPATDWQPALFGGGVTPRTGAGVDVVVHLAARVHQMWDPTADPLAEFRRVNTEGTLNLARQAVEAGVQRMVFVSTIKVNGEGIFLGQKGEGERWKGYSEGSVPAPSDPYAISKWEAEQGLSEISSATGLEVVILRVPLVYGPGVKANFLRLLHLVHTGLPLPFGRVDNRRSLLFVGNLVHAIALCISHPDAANQTFLVCDGEDVSTSSLIRRLAKYMDRQARLLPVPPQLLELGANLCGKGEEMRRMLGSLTMDCSRIRIQLGWQPPFSLEEGMMATARWFVCAMRTEEN